jgi:hypothetical protein
MVFPFWAESVSFVSVSRVSGPLKMMLICLGSETVVVFPLIKLSLRGTCKSLDKPNISAQITSVHSQLSLGHLQDEKPTQTPK